MGESYYQPALRAAAKGRSSGPGLVNNLRAEAVLVADPENPHDVNAVRVEIDGQQVGHLSRDVAPYYQPLLLQLQQRGVAGCCPARLTGGPPDRQYGAYLLLGDPGRLVPLNQPGDMDVLEADVPVAVSGERDHQDVLADLLPQDGRATVFVGLRWGTVPKGKYAGGRCVEVTLDGRRVGRLSSTMSARYADLVPADGNRPIGAEASLFRSASGVELRARLPARTG